jgi:hypothetical protein
LKLILGHNQFLGISHISEKNASEKDRIFSDPSKIYDAVEKAYECGFRQMIVEAHPRMKAFMKLYERNRTFDMGFIFQLPFVSGYVRLMAEGGVKGVAREIISGVPIIEIVKAPFTMTPKLIRKDYLGLGIKALDLEMSKYTEFDIEGVLMHNIVTDMMLAMDAESAYGDYFDRAQKRFGVKAGLITLNLPLLANHLDEWGLEPSMIMSPINPYGFDMNPSKEAVEEFIQSTKHKLLAMNVLGGGSVPLSEASRYLRELNRLEGVVVGASSRKHMEELATSFNGS